jgi:two-component system response regulator FixJ
LDRVIHIVDDDDAVRRSAAFMLKHAGYRTECYESGVAFLEHARNAKNECVLLDVNMPRMGGLEVQQKLTERGIETPVIVVTGSGEISVAVQAMRAGAIHFIEKPYEKEALLGVINEAYARVDGGNGADAADARLHLASLSGYERDVLDGLVAGNPNTLIAQDLNLALRDVVIHRANVMEKLRVRSLAEAIHIVFSAETVDAEIANGGPLGTTG